ncbi:MAG: protein kinase, partial [Planctomycetota bacterium]|nr:protein kinase [Planctomycetota bacterium]
DVEAVWGLITLEIDLRSSSHAELDTTEYCRRFPLYAGRLTQAPPPVGDATDGQETTGAPAVAASRDTPRTLPTVSLDRDAPDAGPVNAAAVADPATVASPPRQFGEYEILEAIAQGAMGVVYRARQRKLDRVVALKMLRSGCFATAGELERFRREAQAAGQLQHPGIVRVLDAGEQDGQAYLAMDFIHGSSLAALVRTNPLAPRQAAQYIQAVAEAVDFAHRHGVVHRDLKPSNILIDADGRPQVTDFGLARRLEDTSHLTLSGEVIGTPSYMPPEQASGKSSLVGPASDVYSLGATLYELLTGRPPFLAPTVWETVRQVLSNEPATIRSINPDIHRDLDIICLKCLNKEPAKRYPSAQALADDLARWLRGEAITARPVGRLARMAKWAQRNRGMAALTGAIAVLLVLTTLISSVGFFHVSQSKSELTEERNKLSRHLSDSFLQFGVDHAEKGDVATGLAYMNLAYRTAQQIPNQRQAALRLLAGWSQAARHSLLHDARVVDVVFSPDRRSIATASEDGTARIWDAQTGEPLTEPLKHDKEVAAVAFSSDGRWLATASNDRTVRRWDAWTGQPVGPVLQHEGRPGAVLFACGDRLLISRTAEGLLTRWDLTTQPPAGKSLAELGSAAIRILQPNAKTLLVCAKKRLLVYDDLEASDPKPQELDMQTEVLCAKLSPDGRQLATGDVTGVVRLWDVADGRLLQEQQGHRATITSFAFSPDGEVLLSGSNDGTVVPWSIGGSVELLAQATMVRRPQLVTLARVLVEDGLAQLSATLRGETHTRLIPLQPVPQDGPVVSVGFDSSGERWLAATQDGRVSVFADLGVPASLTFRHAAQVRKSLFGPDDSSILAAGFDGIVRVWNVPRSSFKEATPTQVTRLALNPDGARLYAGLKGGSLWAMNPATGKVASSYAPTVNSTEALVMDIHLDPLGWIASERGREKQRTWYFEASDPVTVRQFEGKPGSQEKAVYTATFVPGGKSVILGTGSGRRWSPAEDTKGHELPPVIRGAIRALAFSPDGKTLLAGGDSCEGGFWDTSTWQPLKELPKHSAGIQAAAFSPKGDLIATACADRTLHIWRFPGLEPVGTPIASQEPNVLCVAFTPDGQTLLCGGVRSAVRAWDVATGLSCGPPWWHSQSTISHVLLSPDGTVAFTAAGWSLKEEGSVNRWPLPQPWPDNPDIVQLHVEVLTGESWDDETKAPRRLSVAEWEKCRERLRTLKAR